jgi:hypothetical protein
MRKSYEFRLEFDPIPDWMEGIRIQEHFKDKRIDLVLVHPGSFSGFMICGGDFASPEEMHKRIQADYPTYKLVSRWLDRTRIPWHHTYGEEEEKPKPKKISLEEYEKIYEERCERLDALPGGAQGAHPDMSDYEIDEED